MVDESIKVLNAILRPLRVMTIKAKYPRFVYLKESGRILEDYEVYNGTFVDLEKILLRLDSEVEQINENISELSHKVSNYWMSKGMELIGNLSSFSNDINVEKRRDFFIIKISDEFGSIAYTIHYNSINDEEKFEEFVGKLKYLLSSIKDKSVVEKMVNLHKRIKEEYKKLLEKLEDYNNQIDKIEHDKKILNRIIKFKNKEYYFPSISFFRDGDVLSFPYVGNVPEILHSCFSSYDIDIEDFNKLIRKILSKNKDLLREFSDMGDVRYPLFTYNILSRIIENSKEEFIKLFGFYLNVVNAYIDYVKNLESNKLRVYNNTLSQVSEINKKEILEVLEKIKDFLIDNIGFYGELKGNVISESLVEGRSGKGGDSGGGERIVYV